MFTLIVLCISAYALGAVPTSYLLARCVGHIDLRQHGSGNTGGSNLARQLGKRWMAVVLVLDFGRGALALSVAMFLAQPDTSTVFFALIPVFVMIGNCWSPFLGFTGGRSVGVWAGGVLAMSPPLFIAALLVYLIGWRVTRRSAEWMLAVLVALPFTGAVLPDQLILLGDSLQLTLFAACGSGVIILKRMLANGEPLAPDESKLKVLFNRLLRDRDISDRERWLSRSPVPPMTHRA